MKYIILQHSWNPPALLLLKGGGEIFQKLSHLGGGRLQKRGDKPEKGGLM